MPSSPALSTCWPGGSPCKNGRRSSSADTSIAGDFIYIAAGDLLPEAHRRFNWQVILSVLGGMALMFILKLLVPIV